MRTTSTYSDALGLGYLQIIYNYGVCADFDFAGGWNMISLPLEVPDANYLTLFPNANPDHYSNTQEDISRQIQLEPVVAIG